MANKWHQADGIWWIQVTRADIAVLCNALDDHIAELKKWYDPDERFEGGQLSEHAKDLWSDLQALEDIMRAWEKVNEGL